MDVKNSLLNGLVKEDIYIDHLEGFETFDSDTHVCILKRSLYGLKQESSAWYTQIETYLNGFGFTKSEGGANLYYIMVDGKLLILVLYIDNLILTRDENLIQYCKKYLTRECEMKDISLMHHFLGLDVWQGDGVSFLGQGTYTSEILQRFHM